MEWKPGTKTNRTYEGKPLYFIGYSVMKANGKPLLLLHENPKAARNMCGHYTEEGTKPEA